MYTRKGIIYADPYKLLKSAFSVCFQKGGAPEDFIEIDAPITDMERRGNHVFWGNGYCLQAIKEDKDYGWYKERLIKRRYSNDDQIAIILNKDIDEDGQLQYDRMQQWRDWAGTVAKKIVETINAE